jgi:hypothetical protein
MTSQNSTSHKERCQTVFGLQYEEEAAEAAYQSYQSCTQEEQLALWEAYYHQTQGIESSEQTGLILSIYAPGC